MKELSLNILDIAENSIKAKAKNVTIEIVENEDTLKFSVSDDGCGMTEEFLKNVTNPFTTTRTTRPVGLGIPLLKLAAEQTGGSIDIKSKHFEKYPDSHGTVTTATFYKNHIDMVPLGNIVETVVTLIQCNPDINFVFSHDLGENRVELDTKQLKEILGDVPLNNIEVVLWIKEYLGEQYTNNLS